MGLCNKSMNFLTAAEQLNLKAIHGVHVVTSVYFSIVAPQLHPKPNQQPQTCTW